MTIFLRGLALENYRGIGPEFQFLTDFATFNFFVGANNSGKSTFLNFISKHFPMDFHPSSTIRTKIEDLERNNMGGQISAAIGIPKEIAIANLFERHPNLKQQFPSEIDTIFENLCKDEYLWLKTTEPFNQLNTILNLPEYSELRHIVPATAWRQIWSSITGSGQGDILDHWIPQTIDGIVSVQNYSTPRTRIIPAKRQISEKGVNFGDYSGGGLIDRLVELQSPDHDKENDKRKFEKINRLLSTVCGKENSRIEIPHNRNHILVHMDGRVLPLSSLGTGIHEVVMIAAFCTLSENEIICIEEPENHLHPTLQRELIRYLSTDTDNQYFIATHSPSLINFQGASVFHVKLVDGKTTVSKAISKDERYQICDDLGYHASDIIQSNSVIWVEGPSDRIYLNYWIGSLAPELTEGIHYSIMFYGGKLLSHLSVADNDVPKFIELRNLNRNSAIVIDSDKKTTRERISSTKERVKTEFSNASGFVWITKGREIENYLPHEKLQSAVKKIHSKKFDHSADGGQFDHALHYYSSTSPKSLEMRADKVRIAREMCNSDPNFEILDLKPKTRALIRFIKNANAIED